MALRDSVVCGVLVILMCGGGVECVDNYCLSNIVKNNGTYMQFTKETSSEEFAIVGRFKGLHCCAKAYRSIEWVKDGIHYPWPGTSSQFILYPESANQTIYAQNVNSFDAGNYTCILRNDSVVVTHTIQLIVYDSNALPDDPKTTFVSRDARVAEGDPARLFCEAFAGYVDLPDAHYEAIWLKNDTVVHKPHIRQEKVKREDGLTFGTYLLFEKVKPQDYGTYVCRISKPGNSKDLHVHLGEKVFAKYLDPNPIPFRQMMLFLTVIILLFMTILTLNIRFGLTTRVYLKDRFGRTEESDGKENDALIVYSQNDAEIAMGVLLPTLEARYQYKCGSKELPNNTSLWCSHLQEPAKTSRRIVAVISPATLNQNWDTNALYQALKQLQYFESNLTCVLLKDVPKSEAEVKNSQGETLSSVLRTVNVIQWGRTKDDKFWLALRLRLPPKRHHEAKTEAIGMTQGENSSRLKNRSGDSLDELV